jgi:transposase-like protein
MANTSDPSAETTSIIKSDRTGRTRYSAEYRAEVVEAFEHSGMSGPAFAAQCGIKYPTFAAWVAKARKKPGSEDDGDAGQRFLLAEVAGPETGSAMRVELPGGAVAHVSSASQAALLGEILKVLA